MRILYFCLIFMLTACGKKESKPEDILSEKKMALILTDVHLLEAKVDELYLKPDSAQKLYSILERELFVKYEVDSVKYDRSLEYYSARPKTFHKVYELVVDSLMVREKSKRID